MYSVSRTDIGRRRVMNQDTILAVDNGIGSLDNLYIVADGMGGAKAGDYASRTLIEYIKSYISSHSSSNVLSLIRESIEYANKELYIASREHIEFDGMGTTLVMATVVDSTLFVFNIGDSRLYLVRDSLIQISKDHSRVEYEVAMGLLDRDSEEYKKRKNYITRAVGIGPKLDIDIFEVEINDSDLFLLCSDGLSNMVDDIDMYDIITHNSIENAVDILVNTANENGGYDNISAILVARQKEV